MLLALLYFAVRRLLRALTLGSDRDGAARDIEILTLRHQLRVLSRGRRLGLRRGDRILLAAAGQLLPRELWRCLPVSPPEPQLASNRAGGEVVRVNRLGRLIHEYHRIAA